MNFIGQIPSSKSIYNRYLIAQSYFPFLKIDGFSDSDDIEDLIGGLKEVSTGTVAHCGQGGTTLRFLALRSSRWKGIHRLQGTRKLLSRLPEDLERLLLQLSVQVDWESDQLKLISDGWHPMGDCIHVPSENSSQFASALLLNAWDLPFDLHFSVSKAMPSEGYFHLTKKLMAEMGMVIDQRQNDFFVPKKQSSPLSEVTVEADVSTCFSLACVAAVGGQLRVTNFPKSSSQPDVEFVSLFKKMNIPIEVKDTVLEVKASQDIRPIQVNLLRCPDLFPCLAALSLFAKGKSTFTGVQNLAYKESHRLIKMKDILFELGVHVELDDEKIAITPPQKKVDKGIQVDPADDHRVAMAVGVLLKGGYRNIELTNPDVVAKSFRGYWMAIGEGL